MTVYTALPMSLEAVTKYYSWTPTATHYLAFKLPSVADAYTTLRDVALYDSNDATHMPYRFYALNTNMSYSTLPVAYIKGKEPEWYRGKNLDKVSYFLLKPKVAPIVWNPDYLAQWPYSRSWIGDSLINATDLDGPLLGFPMPVRLVSANFNFSEARIDGGDLIFSDGQGHILAHEIERWNAVSGHAEIWVRFDSLAANKINRFSQNGCLYSYLFSKCFRSTGRFYRGYLARIAQPDSIAKMVRLRSGNPENGNGIFTYPPIASLNWSWVMRKVIFWVPGKVWPQFRTRPFGTTMQPPSIRVSCISLSIAPRLWVQPQAVLFP
jgi:hypothetical protein